MGKSIHILYDSRDIDTASGLEKLLSGAGYTVTSIPWEKAESDNYIDNVSVSDCQLILSLNMIGFNYLSSDGGLSINRIPMNIVALMTREIRPYAPLLEKRINYTVSFLVSDKTEVSFIREKYPHLYQVHHLPSPGDVVSYLAELDWRF